jgi:hypothetical protein
MVLFSPVFCFGFWCRCPFYPASERAAKPTFLACGDRFHLACAGSILPTKLLEQALEAARSLPSEAQDDIARVVLQLAGSDEFESIALMPEERIVIAASKAAAARGKFATDEQVRAVWAKHGL